MNRGKGVCISVVVTLLAPLFSMTGARADHIKQIYLSSEALLTPPGKDYHTDGLFVRYFEALAAEAGREVGISFQPWKRAQKSVSGGKHMAIGPLTRTPKREKAYSWLAPIFPLRVAYATRRSHTPITSIAQAQGLNIGLKAASIAEIIGKRHQLSTAKVQILPGNRQILRMLKSGRVDGWLSWDLVIGHEQKWFAPDLELDYGYTEDVGMLYLAGSPDVGEDEVRRWQDAAARLKNQGILSMFPGQPGHNSTLN